MKTTSEIIIDKYLIFPLSISLNILARLLGKLTRINHDLNNNFSCIAVCKYKGMGSIIQATPLLQTLRNNYPNAKIIFISTPGNVAILEKTGLVDSIICLNDQSAFSILSSFPGFIRKLIKLRIEVYIDLEVYSNFSTLITILSMAKNRLGFYIQSKHYRLGNYTHMMYHNTQSPIHETYLQFARLMGCKINQLGLKQLNPTLTQIKIDDTNLYLPNTKYLVINPNASDLRLERRWGKNNYNQLIQLLSQQQTDYKIIVIGGKNEKTYVDEVLKGINSLKIINTAGKTNLEELIALIYHASILITNDSGPMHIGFACKTPTVALFGPCSPNQYGTHSKSISLYKNAYCSPCVHDFVKPPCKGNNQCMQLITVSEVMDTINLIINKHYNKKHSFPQIAYKNNNFVLGTLTRELIKKHNSNS